METMTILIDDVTKIKAFNSLAMQFPCDIDIISGRYIVDGRSLMGLFSLDLSEPVKMRFYKEHYELAKIYFERFEVNNEN